MPITPNLTQLGGY